MSNKRKVCVITGSRADYGLLKFIIREIDENNQLELQIIATGSHLSPSFGNTFQEIEEDGFTITKKIPILGEKDSSDEVVSSISDAMVFFKESYNELKPDMIVVLGDRYEIFAAVVAAYTSKIPVTHIHGGELTEGAYDEAFRHSITKMSHLHFATTREYMNRVIQLGEEPSRVFNYGAPGLEAIKRLDLINKEDLEKELGMCFKKKNILVTYHPETLNIELSPQQQIAILLLAIEDLDDINFIFTKANADTGGLRINEKIEEFIDKRSNCVLFDSLGQKKYFSLLQYIDGVVGNSSSGIIEVPSFKIGTVNIGKRQKGRVKSKSIIDVELNTEDIKAAISSLYSEDFRNDCLGEENPYGNGETSKKIVDTINKFNKDRLMIKSFYDLKQ